MELFFDLVFVFALTQISHLILEKMSWKGLAEAAVAFSAVWLAWIYTTWAGNWAEPERLPVRIMLICVMLASLILAVVLPHAFEDGGLVFALCYVAIQIGRTLFMVYAMHGSEGADARNMLRIAIWFMVSAVVWIAGALLAEGWERLGWWLVALAIEYAGPFALFRVPFLGSSKIDDWTISGHHMAERCALFIIIALGEGIVVTGATFAGEEFTATNLSAFLIAFSGSVLMWWIYFDTGARRGSELIEQHSEPGRVARNAYTYLHMPIVIGMIGGAVADELLLAHPDHHASHQLVAFTCGGMALYLLGVGFFKKGASTHLRFPLSHLAGLSLFGWLGAYAWLVHLPALLFGVLGVTVLLVVAVWEWFSLHGGWQERLDDWRKPT
ncbi:MAG: low temperature requirement protein A [Porphyrobacter sp.]|nr:low temperature requirement protein A [Porphyrobacter sp.]